ncbi:hypothetical protein Dalk_4521 [Desulfatibacillum aliphaticivorans]|uniref:Uncharacterized protein n=1 Tax=Desulfatibacillum aliphaticivorans TaxID=218208 RepID=B8FCN6_DESAL|nr:hypothetical protein Dalk_4521 [Desulfatibacillum aliphaticivorans]
MFCEDKPWLASYDKNVEGCGELICCGPQVMQG